MKRWIGFGFVGVLILAAMLTFIFQREVGERIFERVAIERATQGPIELDDGLNLILCGTGSPLPNPDRAGPCNVVVAGDQAYVVDMGEGGARNLNLMGFDIQSVDGLFITHYHSDHIDGIGPLALLRWTQGTHTTPLQVYGPQGLGRVVNGFNQVYGLDHQYRVAHHTDAIVPASGRGLVSNPFVIRDEPVVVLERDGLTITAFRVVHHPVEPAIGYRFDYRGRSIVISGDTARASRVEEMSAGADILVHDALQPELVAALTAGLEAGGNPNVATITRDILDYHASPEDAATTAQAAGVDMLVLSHLVPPIPSAFFYPAFLGDAPDMFDGEIVVGEDGMIFNLPPESEAIEQSKVL
ncbi:MAG: MBL fold metallo-hydrolase [Pseudomonadota bacterium]